MQNYQESRELYRPYVSSIEARHTQIFAVKYLL